MKIVNIIPSIKKNKKYTAILSTGKEIDFGLDGSLTYLDHKDKTKRENYWKRHMGNKTERNLIENHIVSPSLLSAVLLWGRYDNLEDNIKLLNKLIEDD
jgi:hypothetical protein